MIQLNKILFSQVNATAYLLWEEFLTWYDHLTPLETESRKYSK